MTMHDDTNPDGAGAEIWKTFVNPPDAARPRAWWHWMDGNIDPEGVVRDLRWLHEVGIRGVQLFDGGMGVPLIVPEAVRPGSATWTAAIDAATRTAAELRLELAVATSSGWSAAGGPWVTPTDAMKKVVWSETPVDGGQHVAISLKPLPDVAGLYQDTPQWGGSDAPSFATDWVVLALPFDDDQQVLIPDSFAASQPLEGADRLVDGAFGPSVVLPRDPDARSAAWIEQSFIEPVTVRSVVVGAPGPRGFGAAPSPDAVLQASEDGFVYRDVAVLESVSVPVRSASFAPVTARRFRLLLSAYSAAGALPPMAPGVQLPPVLRRSNQFHISEFALRSGKRVHRSEVKAGFGVVADYFTIDTESSIGSRVLATDQVIDLTADVRDGVLRWDAPPGRWLILRMGASLTGQTNGPAPADSTGLEVDKLDGERVAAYLDAHLTRFDDRNDPETGDSSRFGALLSDSIESGPQNWTDRIIEHFVRRHGYDPLRWLPTLAGYLVNGAEESDRFLYDYRRTISELFADEYYGTLLGEAHRRGMSYYAEALEDGRPQLGDDLAMRSHADVPMGAMWTFEPTEAPRPTYVADLKGASSVAHVYGKAWTGSEAFTSFGKPWSWSPQRLKHIADLQLSLGVTRFCIHTSPHQPLAAPSPGIALAPFLGQSFTVNETWSDMARPWIDYLARCSALLSAGAPAVDIAIFVGEEAPVTGLFNHVYDETVPLDYDFDYVGADALEAILRVEDGLLVSNGAQYRLLFLGGSSHRMTLRALHQIERLLDAGATVVGARPESSPSLADDPAEFIALRNRLWSAGGVVDEPLRDALQRLNLHPALRIEGASVRRIARVIEGSRYTFISNPSADEIHMTLVPAGRSSLVGWDPVDARRFVLPVDAEGRRVLSLAAFASVFIVEADEPPVDAEWSSLPLDGEWRLQVPGGEPIVIAPQPRRWTEFGAHERAFSGTAIYRHEFFLSEADASASEQVLVLPRVEDIARVVVNGHDCGVVWTAPFRLSVTTAVTSGHNRLEVHVANPWRNRLIAEAACPTGDIFAPMTTVFEAAAVPLHAGLNGAVRLEVRR